MTIDQLISCLQKAKADANVAGDMPVMFWDMKPHPIEAVCISYDYDNGRRVELRPWKDD